MPMIPPSRLALLLAIIVVVLLTNGILASDSKEDAGKGAGLAGPKGGLCRLPEGAQSQQP
jgi:hypothetical protein